MNIKDNRGDELFAVNQTFFAMASITVILRCYTRAFIAKMFGPDDWLMVFAWIFFLGYIICSNIGIRVGTGKHREDITPENYVRARQAWYWCYILFGWTTVMAKLSFGWLLLRIVRHTSHAYVIYGSAFMVIVTGVIFFFVIVFNCKPVSHYWNESLPGHCIPIHTYISLGYLYSAFSVATDLAFALLPAFILWHLKIRARVRSVLILLMGLGCLASSAVLVRITYIPGFADHDYMWHTIDIAIWSTIEMGLALTAASLATLRPLARHWGWSIGVADERGGSGEEQHHDAEYWQPANAFRRATAGVIAGLSLTNPSRSASRHVPATADVDRSMSSQATVQGMSEYSRRVCSSRTEASGNTSTLESLDLEGGLEEFEGSQPERHSATTPSWSINGTDAAK